jgi:hypothetical protein
MDACKAAIFHRSLIRSLFTGFASNGAQSPWRLIANEGVSQDVAEKVQRGDQALSPSIAGRLLSAYPPRNNFEFGRLIERSRDTLDDLLKDIKLGRGLRISRTNYPMGLHTGVAAVHQTSVSEPEEEVMATDTTSATHVRIADQTAAFLRREHAARFDAELDELDVHVVPTGPDTRSDAGGALFEHAARATLWLPLPLGTDHRSETDEALDDIGHAIIDIHDRDTHGRARRIVALRILDDQGLMAVTPSHAYILWEDDRPTLQWVRTDDERESAWQAISNRHGETVADNTD